LQYVPHARTGGAAVIGPQRSAGDGGVRHFEEVTFQIRQPDTVRNPPLAAVVIWFSDFCAPQAPMAGLLRLIYGLSADDCA
jgi:hypothetical protein